MTSPESLPTERKKTTDVPLYKSKIDQVFSVNTSADFLLYSRQEIILDGDRHTLLG